MSAAGAERITLFGRRAGVRVFRLNPRGTLNSSERLLFKPDGNRVAAIATRMRRPGLCVP